MPMFLDRCNRRRERLKNLIQTKYKCVHFVIFLCTNNGSPLEIPSVEKMHELFSIIRNICSYSYMHFHILIHPDYDNINYKTRIDALEINTYFHIHYMKRISPAPTNDSEHRLGINWNWNEIFENIKNYDIFMDEVIKIINKSSDSNSK
jgi:hypothetical protein